MNKDHYETPPWLFNPLNDLFSFDIDLCASKDNALVPEYFDEERDSLKQCWSAHATHAFCNPPFSKEGRKDEFIAKAAKESRDGVTTVMVLPSKVDTVAFHERIYRQSMVTVEFLRGRPRFYYRGKQTKGVGRTGIMVVVFWGGRFAKLINEHRFESTIKLINQRRKHEAKADAA